MESNLRRRRTIHFPVTLSVVLICVNVVLLVWSIVHLATLSYWTALTIGTILFGVMLVGIIIYLVLTLKEIRLNQRQANFVDSVTHELKSPIASLKLYLETLELRKVSDQQRDEFYRFMTKDLNRLDRLINQLLEVGRLDAIISDSDAEDIEIEGLLKGCAEAVCSQFSQPASSVQFQIQPATVRGGHLALEMIFRNLIENAIKYSAPNPAIEVEVAVIGKRVRTRVVDNGIGVPISIRKKIFGLFYRGGTELERKQKGTGLGLYIVQTLVKKLRGKVSVHGRGKQPGAVFEVELPGQALPCAS